MSVVHRDLKNQKFPVDELLTKFDKTVVNGAQLVSRLKSGVYYETRERWFFVKVVARHLMKNCQIQDRPSKQEKIDMCQSIIDVFPVLKNSSTGGFEQFYSPASNTGHLELYIRGRRHRDPDIKTLWISKAAKKLELPAPTSTGADERLLRERRPNPTNIDELVVMMERTREERRSWIQRDSPSVTAILDRYPRFRDVPDSFRQEYEVVAGTDVHLSDRWPAYKEAVLTLTRDDPSLSELREQIVDGLDEDKRSLVAFECLVYKLPAPPKRGVKRPRLSAQARLEDFFIDLQNSSVDEAMTLLDERQSSSCSNNKGKQPAKTASRQPLLFRCQGQYFVRADNMAILVKDAGCFAEAVEFLFMCFFVFNVEYPFELRYFYGCLEHIIGLKESMGSSTILTDFYRKIEPFLGISPS